MSPRGSSFAEVVYSILKVLGSRLHVDDIARIGLEKGLLTTRARKTLLTHCRLHCTSIFTAEVMLSALLGLATTTLVWRSGVVQKLN